MRMFVAVVPPPEVVADIDAFVESRRDAATAIRWSRSYQWHLTLAFLPEVSQRALEDLEERLTRAADKRRSFSLSLTGACAFPTPERARVLWLGASAEPPQALSQLATGTRAAANKAGATVKGGTFRPHLTLARFRSPGNATQWLRVLEALPDSTWQVGQIDLIESRLGQGPDGHPAYDPIASFPLGGSAKAGPPQPAWHHGDALEH